MKAEMKLYKVVDWYEGYEVIGRTDSMNEAIKILRERFKDTDGECTVELFKLDKSTNRYERIGFIL